VDVTASRASISEIAVSAGFASQAHLTSAFQRHLGTAPAAYRAGFAVFG
jgi:transcriptional regulator GlxA family with amidase domain